MSEKYVKFLASKEVQKQLKNLQTFFGDTTLQKTFEQIIPFAIVKIIAQGLPLNKAAEQKAAFVKLQKYEQEVCKSAGLLWPSLAAHLNEDEEEE